MRTNKTKKNINSKFMKLTKSHEPLNFFSKYVALSSFFLVFYFCQGCDMTFRNGVSCKRS